MLRVGLTGGIGAGKSTVSGLLAEHGAVIIDADMVAREVVRAGSPGFAAVVQRFGTDVVGADGELDRAALGRLVFADADALADLNAIVHPLVGERSAQLVERAPDDAVVVHDVPLLVENDLSGDFDFVVVVEADEATRLERLEGRGLSAAEARSRIAVQASDEARRALADAVIRNDGGRDELAAEVDRLWRRLTQSLGADGQ